MLRRLRLLLKMCLFSTVPSDVPASAAHTLSTIPYVHNTTDDDHVQTRGRSTEVKALTCGEGIVAGRWRSGRKLGNGHGGDIGHGGGHEGSKSLTSELVGPTTRRQNMNTTTVSQGNNQQQHESTTATNRPSTILTTNATTTTTTTHGAIAACGAHSLRAPATGEKGIEVPSTVPSGVLNSTTGDR